MLIIGIDEVARGCLAGPVVSCAVILQPEIIVNWASNAHLRPKITDSKKMTHIQRKHAKNWILCDIESSSNSQQNSLHKRPCLTWGLGKASAQEIDNINIREATFLAMNRALNICLDELHKNHAHLHNEHIQVWIDGNAFKLLNDVVPLAARWTGGISYHTQVKGDLLIPSIACASILAKEFRDSELDELVANNLDDLACYGWSSNRAYGTSDHFQAILKNGLTVWHRLSFLDKWLAPGRKLAMNLNNIDTDQIESP